MNVRERLHNSPLPSTPELAEYVARYRQYRETSMRLSADLLKGLGKEDFDLAGERLGIMHNGVLVFESEADSNILVDYALYSVQTNGQNAIERQLSQSPPSTDSLDYVVLCALRDAWFSIFVVESIEPGVGVRVCDLANDRRLLVVDLGLSASAEPQLLIATRLVPFDGFAMTTGASIPLGVPTIKKDLSPIRTLAKGYIAGPDRPGADPAMLLRELLARPNRPEIRHTDEFTQPVVSPRGMRNVAVHPREPLTVGRNSPCPCGSGKKYKACCMSR